MPGDHVGAISAVKGTKDKRRGRDVHTISESSQSITIKSAQVKSYGGASPPVLTIFSYNRSLVINRPPYVGDLYAEAEDVCDHSDGTCVCMYMYGGNKVHHHVLVCLFVRDT